MNNLLYATNFVRYLSEEVIDKDRIKKDTKRMMEYELDKREVFNSKEVCQILGISRRTLRYLCEKGYLFGIPIGRDRYYSLVLIIFLLESDDNTGRLVAKIKSRFKNLNPAESDLHKAIKNIRNA